MSGENFDEEFLEELGIQTYKTPAVEQSEGFVGTIGEFIEEIGLSRRVFSAWKYSEEIPTPEDRGNTPDFRDYIYRWSPKQVAHIRNLMGQYAKLTVKQSELLELRKLANAAREAAENFQDKNWEVFKRVACGAEVEEGALRAKLDSRGHLRVG